MRRRRSSRSACWPVRDEAVRLRDTFQELWLRTNLPANLHYAIDEYNAMVRAWDETAERVKRGEFAYDPRPQAEWIYHPDAFAGKPVPHAYFRKTLKLNPADIAAAGLQVQGDTHVKIYVNGKAGGRAVRAAKPVGAGESEAAGRLRHQAAVTARART